MKFLKVLSKLVGSLLFIVIFLLLALKALDFVMFNDYYSKARKEFVIPGLSENFIPQGLTYDSKTNTFITSGYVSGDNTAVLYTIYNKDSKKVLVKDLAGNQCMDHFGGCCVYGDYLLVCGGNGASDGRQFLYTFLLSDVLSADGNYVSAKAEREIGTGAAFVNVYNNTVYVGEFNHNGSIYDLQDESRFFDTEEGKNKAIMLAYDISDSGEIVDNPKMAYSIPDDVQGMCVDDNGNFYFSASWGVNPSTLYKFSDINNVSSKTISINNKEVAVSVLDPAKATKVKTSPMLEEIVYVDGRIYSMNESASSKYIFGNIFRGRYVYSYDTK